MTARRPNNAVRAATDGMAEPGGHDLAALALAWLDAKSLSGSAHSDVARRGDLVRMGRALWTSGGQEAPALEGPVAEHVAQTWRGLSVDALSVERLVGALALLRANHKRATVERTLSTTRGWCRYLTRRGLLDTNPADDELVMVRLRADTSDEPHAISDTDYEQMLTAAAHPERRAKSAWAARDVAILELLAHCGVRAAECCGLTVGSLRVLDGEGGRAQLQVERGAKGARGREVPVAERVMEAVAQYLSERTERAMRQPALSVVFQPALFVANDGTAFNPARLDGMIRRVARQAGVVLPPDAAAHAFRHRFGVSLSLRGVPLPVIQQLLGHQDPRVTTRYTRAASSQLWAALDDAGWL